MSIKHKAAAALAAGTVTSVSCDKDEVLRMIRADEADAMTVGPDFLMLESVTIHTHHAIRFHDRELGAAVRRLTMEGFGL